MMRQIKIWKFIFSNLRNDIPVLLLYVLESKGSSPGRQGFFMAINSNNEMEGSIGGGIMEHKFVELARQRLKERSLDAGVRKQVHDKSAAKDQSGMICSGEQTILLYPLQQKDLSAVNSLVCSLEAKQNGTLQLSIDGLQFSGTIPKQDYRFQMHSENDWLYEEKTGYKNELSIIGGGHCALAFSALMSNMDFYIRIYDERKGLKTMIENITAHEKYFVDDYAQLKDLIRESVNHYVVIMTFGYRTDDIALRALIEKKFKYIGLLGSRSKIEDMFACYKKEGFPEKLLKKVHAPVGIAIKSQTPEEIAISIAAEIIKEKNKDFH
jgi:xanthine dehydrogenase accessory factor